LKLIGEIENVSYNGLWLIRSDAAPKIGSTVFNQQKKKVGRIVNVIGPVSRPYILVRPVGTVSENQLQIIGEKVYIMNDVNSRKKSKRRGN